MSRAMTAAERIADRGSAEGCRVEPGPFAPLIELIRRHPGLDAVALSAAGWDYKVHGSLKRAEDAGVIEWRDDGWHLK